MSGNMNCPETVPSKYRHRPGLVVYDSDVAINMDVRDHRLLHF